MEKAALRYGKPSVWKRLHSLVPGPIHFDISRHLRAPARDSSADEFIKPFQLALNGLESTHRTFSNIVSTIEGAVAHGRAGFVQYHCLSAEQ